MDTEVQERVVLLEGTNHPLQIQPPAQGLDPSRCCERRGGKWVKGGKAGREGGRKEFFPPGKAKG